MFYISKSSCIPKEDCLRPSLEYFLAPLKQFVVCNIGSLSLLSRLGFVAMKSMNDVPMKAPIWLAKSNMK